MAKGDIGTYGPDIVAVETDTNVVTEAGVPRVKLAFAYDYMGRRISKTVSHWDTDHWSLVTDHRPPLHL